jgi:hypothetical protein
MRIMKKWSNVLLVSAAVLSASLALGVAASPEARPDEAASPLPDSSDSPAWWQSRLDLLKRGMTVEEVRSLLPPWSPESAGEGTGGEIHAAWTVSPHWMVCIDFTDRGRYLGPARLSARGEGGPRERPERIARLLVRRPYEDFLGTAALEEQGAGRDVAWCVEEEVEVYADGRYRRRWVTHTDNEAPVSEGTLPQTLTAQVAMELGVGSGPVRIDQGDDGAETAPSPVVQAVLAQVR